MDVSKNEKVCVSGNVFHRDVCLNGWKKGTGSKMLWDVYTKYKPAEFDSVKVLTMFTTAPSNIMSKKPVRTLEDIKGMSLRASGGAGAFIALVIAAIRKQMSVKQFVGAVTFVVASIAKDVPMKDVYKGVSIFTPAFIVCIILLMLFPAIATYLPSLLK